MRRLTAGVMALLLLVAAPAASAAVRRAGSVLPPGQSGFVPLSGLADGTGSPHLTDQTDLFLGFGFKDALFDRPGEETTPKAGVRIVRDGYGVPSIHAANDADLWWGAGYAVAQDRLFQMELFRRATTGHLAEAVGKGYVEMDEQIRRDFYTGEELDAQLAKLAPELRARFDAYRDGVNAWIAETRSDPSKLPGEFAAVGVTPADWTSRDSAAIGVYLARTVPSDDGEELNNVRGLRALGPRLFNRLLPLRIKGQVSTVPASEGRFPSQPGRTRAQERSAYARSRRFVAGLPLPPTKDEAAAAAGTSGARNFVTGLSPHAGASNMWAVQGKRKVTTLFNGPQLGFQIPELFVEFELHRPGYDIRGVTAPGVPVIGIGHNSHVAWGFTSGLSDEDDLYAEQLVDAETYTYKGKTRKMTCRDEEIAYRSPPSDLLGGSPPEMGTEKRRLCRTVHGPVQATAGKVAYARRYAVWGREVETLAGLDRLATARTVKDVDRAMATVTWNENLMAADDRGGIGYWHPGLHPLRPKRFDERLPYPGTGEAEWRGFLKVRDRPHVLNPKQGFLFNWNNVPSQGWTTGDGPARERLLGPFHRSALLRRAVRSARAAGGGWDATARVDKITGQTAQQRPPAARKLRAAARGATGPAKQVLDVLLAWDGNYTRVDSEGKVSPGVATWDAFKAALFDVAFAKVDKKGLEYLRHGAGTSHAMEANVQQVYALRTLSASKLRRAAALAQAALVKRFGGTDWREPRRLYKTSAQGAASFPDIPFFDRGTWQQLVELGP